MKNSKNLKKQKDFEAAGRIPLIVMGIVGKAVMTVFNIIFTVGLIGVIAAAIVGCAFLIYISNNVDMSVDDIIITTQDNELATRLYYYDDDGNLVENTEQNISSGSGATWVEYEDIPTYLRDAFIAIEDKRFWDHNGVDWITTAQAAIVFFVPIGNDRGGSTLTQQLVKNLTGDKDYSIQRKIQEIFRAINLEKELGDKSEIIEQYCNIVYFAQGADGIQEAAQVYFSKDAKDLTLIECAAMAAIVQNPSYWDPLLYPENNAVRRNLILKQMLEQGLITQAEFDEAYLKELVLDTSYIQESSGGTTSWYTDAVIEECIELFKEKYGVTTKVAERMLFYGGYQIITAMDPEIQYIIEDYLEDEKSEYLKNSEVLNHEASFIVIDPYTGQIKGLVGGRGEKTASRILNRATSTTRSPGSSMKPIASYALALDKGIINYGSVLDDTPYTLVVAENGATSFWPRNSNNRFGGLVTVEYALAYSKNTLPVKLVASLGITTVYKFLKNTLGISTLVSGDQVLSALALGGTTYGVTLKDMTTAYGIFPAGGLYTSSSTVVKILDSEGNIVIDNKPRQTVAIKEETAQSMVRLMKSVINYGTAYTYTKKVNKLKLEVAGKTGTTDNNYDKWFIGYSPYYVAGVWIGYDQPQDLGGTHGHIELWDAIMADIHTTKITSKGETLKGFDSDMLIKATFCKDSGKLMTDLCKQDTRGNRSNTGYFTKDTLPTEECDVHFEAVWCATCNAPAHAYCPESELTTKIMLKVDRSMIPLDFKYAPTDTEYVYDERLSCRCHYNPDAPVDGTENGDGTDTNPDQ
ncbi:MAG: hypothetical protein E7633_05525 [Ruminococcaceae bacterium]|nr:hypothetical protein [Oscillospiraceae bacterium]